MGVQGLWHLLQPTGRPVSLQTLDGKVLAVDVSIWLHQAVKGMRDKDGNPLPNAHLQVLFSRICKLLYYRIKPVFVFDGGVPTLKKQTMNARREKRELAEAETDKASKRLLDNLMQRHAVKEVTGDNLPGPSGSTSYQKAKKNTDAKLDIFELPPLPENFVSVEDDDIQNPWNATDLQLQLIQEQYQDVSDIDIESEDFKSLPAEIQHEILSAIKEKQKRLSRSNYKMPEDSNEFSTFQVSKILKQSSLTNKLDEVVKVMNSGKAEALTKGLEDEFQNADIDTRRVMSDESSHIILIKGLSNKKRIEELAKIEEESLALKEENEECCIVEESQNCPVLAKKDKLLIDSDEEDYNIRNSEENVIEIKDVEEDCINKSKNSTKIQDNQMKFSSNQVKDNLNIDSKSGNMQIDSDRSSKNSCLQEDIIELDSVDFPHGIESGVIDVTDDSDDDSTCLVINEDYNNYINENIKDEVQVKGMDCSPVNTKKIDEDIVMDGDKYDNSVEEISDRQSSKVKDVVSVEDTVTNEGKDSDDEGFVEVTIDPSKAEPDDLFPAEIFDIKGETGVSFEDKPIEIDSDKGTKVEKKGILVKQYDAITEEDLENYQNELETESKSLRAEMNKQERLATSITDQMYAEAQELLRLFGIPYVISPMEAEAQCAQLDVLDLTEGTITDDSDIWLFGGRHVYKNFFNQSQHVEFFTQSAIQKQLGLDRKIFINLAMLCGSDYTEGIKGVGPVTAMEILSEFPGTDIEALVAFKSWWIEIQKIKKHPPISKLKTKLKQLDISEGFPNPAVVDAYLMPTVDPSDDPFSWAMPDLDLIREFTHNKLGWSKVKTDEQVLPVLKRLREKQSQPKINRYFQPENFVEPKKVSSVRLKRALQKITNSNDGSSPQKTSKAEEERDVEIITINKSTKGLKGRKNVKRGTAKTANEKKPVVSIVNEINLSETSSSDEDDKILANLDYECWMDDKGDNRKKGNGKGAKKKPQEFIIDSE